MKTATDAVLPDDATRSTMRTNRAAKGIPAPLDRSDDGAGATVDGPDTSADPTGNLVIPAEIVEQVSAAITVDSPRADEHASERGQSAKPRKVQRRVTKPSARPVAVKAIQPKEAPVVGRPPPTPFDEVAALDEEVRQLRRQLTEKLRLQNEQLAGLLKRFDAS